MDGYKIHTHTHAHTKIPIRDIIESMYADSEIKKNRMNEISFS